ncbi:hypothetical protein WR25_07175 isoform A [Diploscapter pachys]|uniref:non-specific serine/threonine protein kinase n=2 Tax=Diploscapter pachys TaxID=2018661 RepID=A0A2A2KUM1_9BILA|nr:hypothetical protein WR25_07175 isoform A [Diploscapter pachys]
MYSGDILESPVGNYEIVEELGNGAFGTVYLTKFTRYNWRRPKKTAVKEIANSFNSDFRNINACLREAQLMKQISDSSRSNHVVRYYESFISQADSFDGPNYRGLFIAMEYCSNGDLANKIGDKINMGRRFNRPLIYDYIYQIADGIETLHRSGIVHRDLKPANILVDRYGNRDVLKITDFGLAKMLNEQNVGGYYPRMYGTPLYMAPEQEDGDPCRFPVDIWAIGLIFYELCISPDEFTEEIRDQIICENRDNLPDRFPEADEIWLDKMTAFNPEDRTRASNIKNTARRRMGS